MFIGPRGTDGFEFRLGKLGLTLFVVGMACLVFAAFQCGVMVGKDMEAYPEKAVEGLPGFIKNKIAAENRMPAPPVVKEQDTYDKPSDKSDVDLTFYDTLGGKKPEPGITPPVESVAKQPVAEPVKEQLKEQPIKPVKKEETEKSKVAGKKEDAEKPKSEIRKGDFVVQVVSMKDEKKAREISQRLKDGGYRSEVDATEIDGKKMYRVRIPGFASRDEANKAATAIEKKNQYKCLVHEVK